MKPNHFRWQWNDEPAPAPDPRIDRRAAANIIRAWRRMKASGYQVRRLAPGTYQAKLEGVAASGILYTPSAK